MASIVEEINKSEEKWRKELVKLLYKASDIRDDLLHERTIEIGNRGYKENFYLREGNVKRTYGLGHTNNDTKTLTIEHLVYGGGITNRLSLKEVKEVAGVLKKYGF